ncbi:MAG: HlyD family secretion protein [Methylococcaceae bacterium]|nr:HlyD family secretion protein [Methylococcaceae bacterium]
MSETKRKPRLLLISLAIVFALVASGYYYLNKDLETTDNAYLNAHVIQIASQVSGPIKQLSISNHQQVNSNDLLVLIDDAPFKIAVAEQEAKLQLVTKSLAMDSALVRSLRSKVDEKRIQAQQAEQSHKRHLELSTRQFVSPENLDQSNTKFRATQATLKQTQSELEQALERIRKNEDQHPAIQEALARYQKAQLDLDYTQIRAPVSGYIENLNIRPGHFLIAGKPGFVLIEANSWWIDANFKENQINGLRPGNKADIILDACPDQTLTGYIDSVANATGSAFALLPPQNASSNWVKVTQRVPVKIKFDSLPINCNLVIGSSASITIRKD